MKKYLLSEENIFGQSVGRSLNEVAPKILEQQTIYGQHVVLHALTDNKNLNDEWIDQIWDAVQSEPDQRCWTYLPYQGFESKTLLEEKLKTNFGFAGSFHYLIEVNKQIVGWVALINIRPEHRAVEIGNVYFSHRMKQSTASTETIFQLLKFCFENHYRRVEWKCDSLNEPSKNAALRFGFTYEGMFRQDRIAKSRNRNTTWFSILDEEWLPLEKAYSAWLAESNFDQDNQQKLKLNDFIKLYSN